MAKESNGENGGGSKAKIDKGGGGALRKGKTGEVRRARKEKTSRNGPTERIRRATAQRTRTKIKGNHQAAGARRD